MEIQGFDQPFPMPQKKDTQTQETLPAKIAKQILGKQPAEDDLYDLDIQTITYHQSPVQATNSHYCPPRPSDACSGVYTCNYAACTGTVCSHC